MKAFALNRSAALVAAALGFTGLAHAQVVINDKLTGTSSSYPWQPVGGACLTAGDGSTSTIPACVVNGKNNSYYGNTTLVGGVTGHLPDVSGYGALRLTNGATALQPGYPNPGTVASSNGNNQHGAIVSTMPFPAYQGVQVTWSTRTYGGNGYPNNSGVQSGADGISFFLVDADKANGGSSTPGTAVNASAITVGAVGGSLGYSCSNINGSADGGGYDGVLDGYLGVGMDEFGNFSNGNDNTSSGAGKGVTPRPGWIAVRGAGHTTYAWLTQNYPGFYPSSLSDAQKMAAVQATCKAGAVINYSSGTVNGVAAGATGAALDYNYPYLGGQSLGKDAKGNPITIFSQEGVSNPTRGNSHKLTYQLSISSTGLMDLYFAYDDGSPTPVLPAKFNIQQANGPLPNHLLFGFSAGTGTGSNVHEITCFKAAPLGVSNGSGAVGVQSSKVQSGSQIYLSYYNPINSWGSLTAQTLTFTPASGSGSPTLTVSAPIWDAGCTLTGGVCASLSGKTVSAPLNNGSRTILSWDGSQAIPFEFGNLSATQTAALTSNDSTTAVGKAKGYAPSDRLDFLRGSRAKEVSTTGGTFRNRSSLLGDIWNSSPVWVGPPASPYGNTWADALNPSVSQPEGASYAQFATNNATRLNVVYTGSNDGMVHGFQAGSYGTDGSFSTTNDDGKEVMAYVPAQVISTIHPVDPTTTPANGPYPALDYSDTLYSHNYFVDAPPGHGDLYYGGAWHTWVVGGLGGGAQAGGPIADRTTVGKGTIYALEVTDPTKFSESSAAQTVMGELSSASLSAAGSPCALTNCGDYLGMTYGTPLIRRLHDGTWALLFGNGYNSKSGTAGLFIAHVNASGKIASVQFLDTRMHGVTSTVNNVTTTTLNGIGQVTSADLDGDHITDYVYAGDVMGNVWRFDLTDPSPANWSAGAKPIFTTQTGQPITSGVAVDVLTTTDQNGQSSSSGPRVIVAFGTGQQMPQTLNAAPAYPTTKQSLYGIWDADMSAWNKKSGTQLAAIATASIPAIVPGTGGNLLVQSLSSPGTTSAGSTRTSASNAATTVCWSGSTACTSASSNTQMGWEMDLSVQTDANGKVVAEQAIYSPTIAGDVFNINTMIPSAAATTLTCDPDTLSGYSIGITMAAGAPLSGGYFVGYDANVVAIPTQATGTSTVVGTSDGSTWLVFQKNDGTGGTQQVNIPKTTTTVPSRLTWTKLR